MDIRIISRVEVCKAFQITEEVLSRWEKDHWFPPPLPGREVRYSASSIDTWLEDHRRLKKRFRDRALVFKREYEGEDAFLQMEKDLEKEVFLGDTVPDEFRGTITMTIVYEGDDI